MAWEARAAPHPAMGRFVTTVPLDARASSLDALEALRRGDPAAAAQLRDLAAAAEVRRELAPAAVQTALAQVEVPLPYFDHSLFSPQHPSLLGHADSFGAARDLALAALARRVPLSAPRPAVVLRIAPPGSEEAERLAQQGSEWLHGTPQHPLPATVRQRREQQLATFVAHMTAAADAAEDRLAKLLLQLLAEGRVYFVPLSCRPALWGLLGAPDVAGIRIAGCLGPATSKLAVIMGWLLSAGAGAHELRAERPSVVELLGVAGMLYSMGSLSQFQAQLRGLTVWYGKTKDASVQPFTDRTTGDDLIRISMERAAHNPTTGDLCGLNKAGFTGVVAASIDAATLEGLKLGKRPSSTEVNLSLGAEGIDQVAQLARVMGGPDAAHYAALAAVVQASPYLMQELVKATLPLKFLHQLFYRYSLDFDTKHRILLCMSTKERAAFFFLEGIAQNSMLQELRCLQMHGMIQGLSLVEEWPSFTPALPGGAAELETARQEVLQGHDLPGSPWDYSVQDWELVKEVPFRYRTPVEAVLLDMLQCSRPRCYLLGVMMRQHYRPTQSAPTEEHAEQVHKSLGAIMLARYLGRFAADLEQAAPSPAAVVARLGSQGALQVFAAAVELCRGWLPDDDEFVGASVIGGQQLLSVAEEDICAAPEVEDYPDWSRALSSTPVLAALRVRWPHEISKEKTAINAAKAAKAAAAAEPGVSGRRGGRRGGQGGGAASSGGGDLNQPSLADVAPAAEAAVHNAWQVLIAQLLGMLGREDGARLASTATSLLSSHFDDVLEQGRVPDAMVVEAFKDILPPGLPTSTVHARLAAMQPTHIDKQLSLLTKQPPGSAAWAASSSPQRQRAMQVERQKTGGAKTVVRLFADAAAAAAAGGAEQRPAEGTDGGQQGVGGQEEEEEEEEEEEGGMWQEAAAAAAAAEADEAAAAAAAAAAGAAADEEEEAQDEQQEEQQEEQDGGSVESEEEPQQQQQAQQVLQRGRQGLLVRAGAAGASRAAWSASSGGGASNSGEDDSDEEEASDGENDENWAPQHGKRGKRQRSGAAGGSGSGARTALQPAQQRRRLLAAQGFQMPRPAARAASGGSSATAGGKRSGTLGVARQMRN